MENLNQDIGIRLREVRHIFNEGEKLSARQFAHLLGETHDKILNYENGRASVSVQLLINLYKRVINPTYILTGEGSIYADNAQGLQLMRSNKSYQETANIHNIDNIENLTIPEMLVRAEQYSVAAGDILKILKEKSSQQKD